MISLKMKIHQATIVTTVKKEGKEIKRERLKENKS
jgi:hypothetical protein